MIMAAVVVVIYGMQMMSVLLVPFLIAAFLALITVKPMLWLQAHRVPSFIAALLIVTMLMLILATVGAILGSSIAEFTASLPAYQARLDVIIDGIFKFIVKNFKVDESIESMGDMIDPGFAMGLVAGLLNNLREVLTNTFLIVFTMIFMLLEAGTAGTKFEAAFGRSADTLEGLRDFMQNLGRYLGIKTLVAGPRFSAVMGHAGIPAELCANDRLHHCSCTGGAAGADPAGTGGGECDRPRFCFHQRRVRQLPGAETYGLRRGYIAPGRVRRPRRLGMDIRPRRHVAVGTADDDAQDGARKRRPYALGRNSAGVGARCRLRDPPPKGEEKSRLGDVQVVEIFVVRLCLFEQLEEIDRDGDKIRVRDDADELFVVEHGQTADLVPFEE